MARTSILEDLFKVSKQVPWWASTALGAGLYFLFKHYLPTAVPETLSTAWTPLFAAFAYLLLGICLAGTAAGLIKRWQDRRRYDRQTSIESIRDLSWQDFERFVLEAMGLFDIPELPNRIEAFRMGPPAPDGRAGDVSVIWDLMHSVVRATKHAQRAAARTAAST